MPELRYIGTVAVPLYGAARGVIDLGANGLMPTYVVPQVDLRSSTTSTIRLSLLCSRASSNEIGDTFAAATAGHAFANQPANDGVEVLSDTVADVGRVVTIYGTTTGTNMVTKEEVTLNTSDGTTVVSASKTDWGYILGVEVDKSDTTAVITIREASGDQAITTIAAATTSHGVTSVVSANQPAYDLPVSVVGDNATTKVVGVIGKDCLNRTIYDAITLTGTTAALGLQGFRNVTHLLTGDLESARTVTFSVGGMTYGAAGATLTDLGSGDPPSGIQVDLPYRYLHWCLYDSTTAATAGVADRLLLAVYG